LLEILEIEPESIAEELEIQPGSKLISINGKEINDELDYRFQNNGEELEVLIDQDGESTIFEIEKDPHQDLGLIVEEMKMRKCGNRCIFCFVHQSPKGLRRPLYFKDEDYRFSFLHGHYVTLTNTSQQDLERIVEQRLTPLYVSVHVTDLELRKHMLGIKFDDHLLQKLDYLTSNGIELQTQIVLCPGINDGEILDKTIADLKQFYPKIGSIAIVPVGLTKHRAHLPPLPPVTNEYSLETINKIDIVRQQLFNELDSSFVYLSDEFYIRTNTPLPQNNYYEDFNQLENGVGLTRDFVNRFDDELQNLKSVTQPKILNLVSGTLGALALKQYILPGLDKIQNLKISIHPVTNQFYGESITVAGLIVGQDIYDTLKDVELGDYIILPPRVLNHNGLFLDDLSIEELENKLGQPIFVFPDSFTQLFKNIEIFEKSGPNKDTRKLRHTIPVAYVTEQSKGNKDFF
jgi:putative radical SAM enzyme (TIGR03279 family)